MPIYAIILLAVVLFMGTVGFNAETERNTSEQAEASAISGNIKVYRNAVLSYARANTGYTGTVPDTALSALLPTWYRKASVVNNYVQGGRGFVYVMSPAPTHLLEDLVTDTGNSIYVGINRNGQLVNPSRGNTGITLPGSIPNNSVVYAN